MNSELGKQRTQVEQSTAFVLDKSIFSNVFERDIRRVYIYKKAERLAKALQLVAPAFRESPALASRIDTLSVQLIDAAVKPIEQGRHQLSEELLSLTSILALARSGGRLSAMNADLITREAHQLLDEVASYEEPQLSLPDSPSLAHLARDLSREDRVQMHATPAAAVPVRTSTPRTNAPKLETVSKGQDKGQAPKVAEKKGSRREAILAILRTKESVYIKDVSTVLRDVSEKTVQRELQSMVEEGVVTKSGERRWTTYALR